MIINKTWLAIGMPFESEAERLAHPQIGRIPENLWYSIFRDMDDDESLNHLSAIMENPTTALNERLASQSEFELDKEQKMMIWIALSYSASLFKNEDELIRLALGPLGLTKHELFTIATVAEHFGISNKILAESPTEALSIIQNESYQAFRAANKTGQLLAIDYLAQEIEKLAPGKTLDMIKAEDYEAFRLAAQNGQLPVIETLIRLAPKNVLQMIQAGDYEAFRLAAANGHLSVIEKLIELAPDEILEMIQERNHEAFRWSAINGHLPVMKRLIELAPTHVLQMLRANNYVAFESAVRNKKDNLIQYLMNFPSVFAYAEPHWHEYGAVVRAFIYQKLQTIKNRLAAHHPPILTQQEAQLCFYMLRHLIRRSELPEASLAEFFEKTHEELFADIDFLMGLPAVASLLHRSVLDGPTNELLREAMRQENTRVVDRLFELPNVRAQAERDGFYQSEAEGEINLRELARDRESSMAALTPAEQAQLEQVEEAYPIHEKNLDKTFEALMLDLQVRYLSHPATVTLQNGKVIPLPLNKADFDSLSKTFTEKDKQNANIAYYQHPVHTAFRYLSKPNPWMYEHASYVYADEDTGERWSTFEDYKMLICQLWLAAKDEAATPIDDYTLETRMQELIQELALIGRAHNWDKTNEKGQEHDDLEADKPSCFSGTKRRLLQALKGHHLYKDIRTGIHALIRERFRTFVQTKLQGLSTQDLETLISNYEKLSSLGEASKELLNISSTLTPTDEDLAQWEKDIQHLYAAWKKDDRKPNDDSPDVLKEITQEAKKTFFDAIGDTNPFLKNILKLQLDTMCMKELQTREDDLIHRLDKLTENERVAFLEEDDAHHLKQAIYLGLLNQVAQLLPSNLFNQLLCKDEGTIDRYAELLTDTKMSTQEIQNALTTLDKYNQQALLGKILEMRTIPPLQTFSTFLRALTSEDSEEVQNKVEKLLIELRNKDADTQQALSHWRQNQAPDLVAQVYQKALELHLIDVVPNDVQAAVPNHDPEPAIPIINTYDGLPDDPTGELLKALEETLKPPALPTSGQHGFFHHVTPSEDAPGPNRPEP